MGDMHMNKMLIGCVALLWTGSAASQIIECVDAKGKKEYAQVCPPGTVKENKLMNNGGGASANTAPAQKSLAEKDADFRKRAMERQEAEKKADKDKSEAVEAERNCSDARGQLRQLQDGLRVARTDPKTGDRVYLEDKDRPGEIAKAQKS